MARVLYFICETELKAFSCHLEETFCYHGFVLKIQVCILDAWAEQIWVSDTIALFEHLTEPSVTWCFIRCLNVLVGRFVYQSWDQYRLFSFSKSSFSVVTKLLKGGCGYFLVRICCIGSLLNYRSLFQILPDALREDKQTNLRPRSGRWNNLAWLMEEKKNLPVRI